MQPSKKREGRLDMLRSAPIEKAVVKVERVVDNADEEDKKYFREDFNLTYDDPVPGANTFQVQQGLSQTQAVQHH